MDVNHKKGGRHHHFDDRHNIDNRKIMFSQNLKSTLLSIYNR